MKLFDLGTLPWKDTQLIYHALAQANIESLVIHSCDIPYACLGFPHNPNDDLDLEYCRRNDIPLFRREIGGGTVLLDKDQIFIHLILKKDNPLAPRGQLSFFKKFLDPVIKTYADLGISVEYRPINDLAVDGRKISGTGGGEIGESLVMGSSILLDFNYELMANILNVPNEVYREKVLRSMDTHLTTVLKELGHIPPKESIKKMIVSRYGEIFGEFERGEITDELRGTMDRVEDTLMNDTWLFQRGMKQKGRNVKIIEGVNIIHREYFPHDANDRSGIRIELVLEVVNNRIAHVDVLREGVEIEQPSLVSDLLGKEFNDPILSNAVETYPFM